MDIKLNEDERIDDLEFKNLKIIQNKNGFCFGIDAVLLSDFAKNIKNNAKVLDLGTGTGIISILLCGKTNLREIIGVEVQEEVYEILSSFDNANIEILSDIISGFRFASEHNIKTTNEQLQAFRQNMHWDLGFMLRVISLDFKSLEKTSFSNKKALISEMEKLVSKYAQLSEMHNIEEY